MDPRELFVVRIGKKGITLGVIEEIERQLKKRHIVKIKFLHSSVIDRHDFKEKVDTLLSMLNDVKLVETRGRTVIIEMVKTSSETSSKK